MRQALENFIRAAVHEAALGGRTLDTDLVLSTADGGPSVRFGYGRHDWRDVFLTRTPGAPEEVVDLDTAAAVFDEAVRGPAPPAHLPKKNRNPPPMFVANVPPPPEGQIQEGPLGSDL